MTNISRSSAVGGGSGEKRDWRFVDNNRKLIAGLQAAWTSEIAGAKTYRALAQRAPSPEQRGISNRLADAEERHAETWATRLKERGSAPPEFRESFLERARRWVLV
jgi:rubrerythrin